MPSEERVMRAREVLREFAAFHGRPLDTIVATENAIRAMLAFADEGSGIGDGREDAERCVRCGGDNPSWSAPSPLWNAVMRGGSINGDALYSDMVCVKCFMRIAESAGIARGWRLVATDVSAHLETITPSGRVWNERTWLWEENAAHALDPISAVVKAWRAVDQEFGVLFVDEDGPVREIRDMDAAVEALASSSPDIDRSGLAQEVE